MWLGEYAEGDFCKKMFSTIEEAGYFSRRTFRIVNLVKNEVGLPPTFFNIDRLSSSIGRASIPTEEVFKIVRESGFKIVRTHFEPRGVKTDASIHEIRKLLKE